MDSSTLPLGPVSPFAPIEKSSSHLLKKPPSGASKSFDSVKTSDGKKSLPQRNKNSRRRPAPVPTQIPSLSRRPTQPSKIPTSNREPTASVTSQEESVSEPMDSSETRKRKNPESDDNLNRKSPTT